MVGSRNLRVRTSLWEGDVGQLDGGLRGFRVSDMDIKSMIES